VGLDSHGSRIYSAGEERDVEFVHRDTHPARLALLAGAAGVVARGNRVAMVRL
jgi:hypothetical protein